MKCLREHERAGRTELRFRHRVDALTLDDRAVRGVSGAVLAPTDGPWGEPSCRDVIGDFTIDAEAVIATSGGIGGNLELVRKNWPARLGAPPESMVIGVPAHVDGRMLEISERAGGRLVNRDRMWHYTEGIKNFAPI